MLTRSYNEYSRDPFLHDDVIIYQTGDDPRLSSLSSEEYVQTFSTSNDFNVLHFVFNKDTDDGKYLIDLRQGNKKIAKMSFKPSELNENSEIELVLPETCHPDGKTEYKITVKAKDNVKPEESSEAEKFLDLSPDRTLRINGVQVNRDLQLKVFNRVERVTIPKPVFFTSAVIYIGLELVCVAGLWKKRKEAVKA
jgi:hypothetical protein